MDTKRRKLSDEKELLYRKSFDRFCDDLTEVLLSYLSFEDKIRLQCVSQQFQRLVFNKQKCLEIHNSGEGLNLLSKLVIKTDQNEDFEFFDVNICALESVLKKFKFINEIHFGHLLITNRRLVLKAIIENCNELKTIGFDFCKLNVKILETFGHKFGKSLTDIKFLYSPDLFAKREFKPLIKLCPNLLTISGISFKDLFNEEEVLVHSLAKLSDCSLEVNEKDLFALMAQKYENTFKCLEINATFNDANDRNVFFRHLSLLKSLEILSIITHDCDLYSKEFTKSIQLMAKNCNQFKKLSFSLINRKSFDRNDCFESFGKFVNLRELHFMTPFPDIHFEDELNINCLQNCKLLTHLEIKSQKINDNLFTEIHSIVPQLKVFNIITDEDITDIALESISKLKNLEDISFDKFHNTLGEFKSITDSGLMSVINSCENLESIEFHKRPNITHKTIELVIEKAIKNPRIYFELYFEAIEEESEDFTAIDLETYDPLPNNIEINE